jgi:hypothetical protein
MENVMDEFDELAGRIEGVARALLHTVAALEAAGMINGPRLSSAWRQGAPAADAPGVLPAAGRTLHELAQALDDARRHRRSAEHRAGSRTRRASV